LAINTTGATFGGTINSGAITSTQSITLDATAGSYPLVHGKTSSYTLFRLEQWYGNEGFLGLYADGNLKVKLTGGEGTDKPSYIDNGQNFGIGLTNPTNKLEVSGTFKASGNATFGGNVILDDGDTNNSNNLTFENTGYTNYEMDCTSGGFRLFRTGQSVALSADVNHIVTRPQQPSFLAYSLGFTKGSASSGWEEIGDSLTTVDHNVGGHLSGGTFTAPVDGIYQFSFGGYSTYSDTDGYNRYAIAFSHTDYDTRLIFGGNYSNSDSPMSGGSITIKMTANETMKLKAYSSIASATTWGNSSHAVWWSGHLLG